MRQLKQYGIALLQLTPLVLLLHGYSPLPYPETVFYNMPSPVLQNKNLWPLPNTLSTKIYVPLYLNSRALVKNFLPIFIQTGFNPKASSQELFESHNRHYTGYTRQIYELSLYLKLQSGLSKFLAQQPVPTPYTTQGLANKFRDTLDTQFILGIDNNPLYFKTQLQPMLDTLLHPLPKSATRAVLLTAEFAEAVVFPTHPVIIPELPYPSLSPQARATHLKDMAEHINWRLLIAGTKQQIETALTFDKREPGCLIAMARAFKNAIRSIDEPLSLQKVITTHQLCVENVSGELNEQHKKHPEQPFRKGSRPVGYSMNTDTEVNITPEGKKELCLYENVDQDYTFRYNYLQTTLYGDNLKNRIEEILAAYNQQMDSTQDPQQKLYHIVSTLSLLERIHPFWDANGRTFCTVLLNRELLRHGFPTTVLENPNYCDGYSTPDFMQEILKGFDHYQYVKENGHFPGESKKPLDPENQNLMAQLKQIFLETADALQ